MMGTIPKSEIHRMLKNYYGISASVKELPAYEDLNYIINHNNRKSILKITVKPEAQISVAPQTRVLDYLNSHEGIKGFIPEVLPSLSGEKVLKWSFNGEDFLVRVLSFLEGKFMGEEKLPSSFYYSLGRFAGKLDGVLAEIDEPLFRQLDLDWDLKNFQNYIDLCKYIVDQKDRVIVEYFFLQYQEEVAPLYHKLRKSLIHNDINDWNILSSGKVFSGLIDFGDMVNTATIHELAIAMAYGMMNQDEPLSAAHELVRGYNSAFKLLEEELDLLYYLTASRLCTTIVLAARKAYSDPGNEYYQISAGPAIEVLRKWIRISPIRASRIFLEACGITKQETVKSKRSLLDERSLYLPQSLSVSYTEPIRMTKAALQYMYDEEGNTFLDCVNNIPHVGHCHPGVVLAGQKQIARLNTNTRYIYESLNEYAKRLLAKFPSKLSKVLFVNSGSAATDLAIRLAKNHTGKDDFIVLDHAYHGNVSTAIGLSPYKFNHKGGAGKPFNTHIAPIPDIYRGIHRKDKGGNPYESCVELGNKYAGEIDILVRNKQLEARLAGFIAESIPGCGGQIVLPKNYLAEVYKKIRALGGLCIADEVQTGFGRVGEKFWAFELYDVIPDIVILGKPMGNGHPMGAVVFTDEIAESFNNGLEFFSSFGGNPVSCETGLAVLDAIEDDKLQENAKTVGDFLLGELEIIRRESEIIGDVRGRGLFIGIEIVSDLSMRTADPDTASRIVNKLKNRHILLSTDGPDENVIKFKPPLCFSLENAGELIEKFREVLTQI